MHVANWHVAKGLAGALAGLALCVATGISWLLASDPVVEAHHALHMAGTRFSPEDYHGQKVVLADLMGVARFDRDTFRLLRTLPRLRELNLSNPRVNDDILKHLANLPSLEALYLSGTRISDGGMMFLRPLKRLQTLNLADTAITDEGLKQLPHIGKLHYLHLGSTRLSDAGLTTLRALPELTLLDLNGTQVTPEAIEELRRARPNLDVYH